MMQKLGAKQNCWFDIMKLYYSALLILAVSLEHLEQIVLLCVLLLPRPEVLQRL